MKRIDFTKEDIEIIGASGKKYKFCKYISIERYKALQKIELEVSFGISFEEIYKRLLKAKDLGNDGKGIDAWNIIMNIIDGLANRLEDRVTPVMKMCALFLNYEGENDEVYNDKDNEEKARDLERSGYAVVDFFQLAFNLIPGFVQTLRECSQSILRGEKAKEKIMKAKNT